MSEQRRASHNTFRQHALRWWTRTQRIRTAGAAALEVPLLETAARPAYQEIAVKAKRLRRLGLNDAAIARRLGVTGKTVAKAISWLDGARRGKRWFR